MVERAEHPEALFEPEWESCGEGCEALTGANIIDPGVGAHDGERGYFSVIQSGSRGRVVVLAITEGPPVAAWRSNATRAPGVCSVFPLSLSSSATHVGFNARVYGEGWPRQARIYHAPIEEIGQVTEPVAVLDHTWLPGGNSVQHLAVSTTTVAGEVQLAGYIAVVEDGVLGRLIDMDSAVRGTPQRLQMVGRTVYWTDYADRVRIARGSMTEPPRHYYEAPGADVAAVSVDGEWVAWQQQPVGGDFENMELWASPFADDPALLEPRRVAALGPFSSENRMGAGIYALEKGHDRIELYDLDDGRRRVFRPPAEHRIRAAPLYVTADEMLLATRVEGRFSLLRVQLDGLPYEE